MHRNYAIALWAAVLAAPAAQALAFNYTTIDKPGATLTAASGISSSGTIVGRFDDGAGQHGFSYSGGTFTPLDVPASFGNNTNARAISGGNIGGFYSDSSKVFHGFTLTGSTYTPVNEPDAGSSAGQGTRIFGMDGAQLVGDFLHPSGLEQGWLFNGTSYEIVAPGPSVQSAAFGIQGSIVVGAYVGGGSVHGMIFDSSNPVSGAGYSTLDDPLGAAGPGQGTEIFGVDGKHYVGRYIDSSSVQHGFYYDGSGFATIDYPGASQSSALGISGNTIVGSYTDASGVTHGFVTAVPEPAGIALLALGALGLFAAARRRASSSNT